MAGGGAGGPESGSPRCPDWAARLRQGDRRYGQFAPISVTRRVNRGAVVSCDEVGVKLAEQVIVNSLQCLVTSGGWTSRVMAIVIECDCPYLLSTYSPATGHFSKF